MADAAPDKSGHLEHGSHRIWWEYFGDGEREAVVLLNGLAMHTKAWYGFLDQLTDEFDVLLYDYLGQGESSCPDEPYFIPDFCHHLTAILDHLGTERVHVMGISYGGFIALDYARLYQERIHTLTLSGILLSHERQFEMYQDLSLRFYRSGPVAFEIYTHYLYEKIFGEEFLRSVPAETLETMRQRFHDRYKDRVYCLVRLTEAQNPFFDGLEERLPEYRAVRTPTMLISGSPTAASSSSTVPATSSIWRRRTSSSPSSRRFCGRRQPTSRCRRLDPFLRRAKRWKHRCWRAGFWWRSTSAPFSCWWSVEPAAPRTSPIMRSATSPFHRSPSGWRSPRRPPAPRPSSSTRAWSPTSA
jgi:pimeloyl-ACP methyl ester carboxylesterase